MRFNAMASDLFAPHVFSPNAGTFDMKRQKRREGATKVVSLITSLTQSNLKILMKTRDFEKFFRGKAGMEI